MENGCLTTTMHAHLECSKVCSFMQINHKEWDDDMLRDICNERDRNLIKKVTIPRREEKDNWFWLLDEKGCFTVRSCYRVLQWEIDAPYAKVWRRIWNLKLLNKVIHFIWRACSLCFPTTSRLAMKRVQIDLLYPWCRLYPETDKHVLFECEIAAATWVELGL